MKVTIFGATGLLGKALTREWQSDQVTRLGSQNADLRNVQQIQNAVEHTRPDWIVLAAAYTDVDGCEANPDRAFEINCQGAVNVAHAAQQSGARVLFLSTDYVFDGNKTQPYEIDDPRAPQSVYGKSKADAEVRLLEIMPEICIVRTSWLFGAGGKCFPDTILKLAAAKSELDVVNDQRGSPTYAVDLARAIIHLCRNDGKGIIHATNKDNCTWFEFAREIVSEAGLHATVRPTTSEKFVRPAARPKYSVLSSGSLQKYQFIMPGWQDALGRYMSERNVP
jgi:dTDP-4-dehydrorhamnose reductase